MRNFKVGVRVTSGMTLLTGMVAMASTASAQECIVQEIFSAGDSSNANDVTSITNAAMNTGGTVVISVEQSIDVPNVDDVSRILQWTTSDPGADPTANPLVDSGARSSPYQFVSGATINEAGEIIFVGKTTAAGLNVFNLAGTPLLSFAQQAPLSIGDLVLLENSRGTSFIYWKLSLIEGEVQHCVLQNDSGAVNLCGDNVRVYVQPDANNNGDVYVLKVDAGINRQIRDADDFPICTVPHSGTLTGPSVNADGMVAFYASHSCDGSGDPAGEGIYLHDPGADTTELVVSFADPGLEVEAPQFMQRPILNDDGRIAFAARVAGEGAHAIFIYSEVNSDRIKKLEDGADPDHPRKLFGFIADPDDQSGLTDRVLFRGVNMAGLETLFLLSGCPFTIEPTGCPGDLNGDGEVDGLDLLALLSDWGPCKGCPADLNGDGEVDGLDLLTLLSNWGPCPDTTDCGDTGSGSCCIANNSPSCDNEECCAAICAVDSFCCDVVWDSLCAVAAAETCFICGAEAGCGVVTVGDCCEEHDSPFCNDAACCDQVCAADPFCCENLWDDICAQAANDICAVCGGGSCAGNCGGGSGEPDCYDSTTCDCYCDSVCFSFGDCCDDVCVHCVFNDCDPV